MFTQNELYYSFKICRAYIPRNDCHAKFYEQKLLRVVWKYLRERRFIDNEHPIHNQYFDTFRTLESTIDVNQEVAQSELLLYRLLKRFWEFSGDSFSITGASGPKDSLLCSDILDAMEELHYYMLPAYISFFLIDDKVISDVESVGRLVSRFDPYDDYYLPKHSGKSITIKDGMFTRNSFDARVAFTPSEDLRLRAYFCACICDFHVKGDFDGLYHSMRTPAEEHLYGLWPQTSVDMICQLMLDDWRKDATESEVAKLQNNTGRRKIGKMNLG